MSNTPELVKELIMADDLMPMVEDGSKRITVRKGDRAIVPGPLTITNVSKTSSQQVQVHKVTKTLAGKISLKDLREDGFEGLTSFLEGMKRYYPDFNAKSPITVIRW